MKAAVGGAASVLVMVVVIIAAALTSVAGLARPLESRQLAGAEDIPAVMSNLYEQAAGHFGIPVGVLAGIGKLECNHNRNPACGRPNYAGAVGPMQFLPTTFVAYAGAAGSSNPSPYDARDAVFAAAAMLKANGVLRDTRKAVFSYNHSQKYVDDVLRWAKVYESPEHTTDVIEAARSYIGVPYLWGGTSRSGLDCSGLVLRAFSGTGVKLPRVSQDQSRLGRPVSSVSSVQPGDLLAYGNSTDSVTHIAIASGNGKMIEAARAGTRVREVKLRTSDLVSIRRVLT